MKASHNILWLNDQDVATLLTPEEAATAVCSALKLHASGDFEQPPKPYIRPGGREDEYNRGRFIYMPAYLGGEIQAAGIKIIAGFPANVDRGLPRASGVYVLNSTETGLPVAIMECGELSARRTAGTASVALAKLGARKPNQTVSVFGAGPIAAAVMKTLALDSRVCAFRLFDPRTDRAQALAVRTSQDSSVPVQAVGSIAECLSGADIVVLATTGAKGYVTPELLDSMTSLVIALSLDDVTPEVFLMADKVVVDSFDDCCREEKLLHRLVKDGLFSRERVWAELGDVLLGRKPGRISDSELVYFNPMGMGIEDLAVATTVFRRALNEQRGMYLPLGGTR
jgi:ornithine cyclodeaminase